MTFDVSNLHAAVSAVCPIVIVTMGNPNDRATWNIVLASTATPAQIAAAKAAIAAFQPAAPPVVAPGPVAGTRLNGNGV